MTVSSPALVTQTAPAPTATPVRAGAGLDLAHEPRAGLPLNW